MGISLPINHDRLCFGSEFVPQIVFLFTSFVRWLSPLRRPTPPIRFVVTLCRDGISSAWILVNYIAISVYNQVFCLGVKSLQIHYTRIKIMLLILSVFPTACAEYHFTTVFKLRLPSCMLFGQWTCRSLIVFWCICRCSHDSTASCCSMPAV